MKNYLLYTWLLLTSIMAVSCSKENDNDIKEDYSSFIELKKPTIISPEPGLFTDCFPSKPGELGCTIKKNEGENKFADTYNITIRYEYETNDYSPLKMNNSELIIQYLDNDNKLKIDTLLNHSNHYGKEEGGYHSEDIQLTKKSGDPFYFAVFYSPYADFYTEITANIELKGGGYSLSSDIVNYSINRESYHITEPGKEYYIQSKLVYLP